MIDENILPGFLFSDILRDFGVKPGSKMYSNIFTYIRNGFIKNDKIHSKVWVKKSEIEKIKKIVGVYLEDFEKDNLKDLNFDGYINIKDAESLFNKSFPNANESLECHIVCNELCKLKVFRVKRIKFVEESELLSYIDFLKSKQ